MFYLPLPLSPRPPVATTGHFPGERSAWSPVRALHVLATPALWQSLTHPPARRGCKGRRLHPPPPGGECCLAQGPSTGLGFKRTPPLRSCVVCDSLWSGTPLLCTCGWKIEPSSASPAFPNVQVPNAKRRREGPHQLAGWDFHWQGYFLRRGTHLDLSPFLLSLLRLF